MCGQCLWGACSQSLPSCTCEIRYGRSKFQNIDLLCCPRKLLARAENSVSSTVCGTVGGKALHMSAGDGVSDTSVDDRRRLRNRIVGIVALCVGMIPILNFSALAAGADKELQARLLVRSVVSRVAFLQVVGYAIDLPSRLTECANSESRTASYQFLKMYLSEQSTDAAATSLCHPHVERVHFRKPSDLELRFAVPSLYCSEIQNRVRELLSDFAGKQFHEMLDRQAQRKIRTLFDRKALAFPNTSSHLLPRAFDLSVGSCLPTG